MAHGETEQHCADDERPARPDPAYHGRPVRRAWLDPAQPAPRADQAARADRAAVDDHADADDTQEAPARAAPACRNSRPGWAGAHRHLGVRPRRRASRRERPPDRWC
jgi:hypothetical protein